MITDRDREIINFIEIMGFITIEQCAKMFFSENKTAYDLARRRLRKIYDNGNYIKRFRNNETNTTVYVPIDSKVKNISTHSIKSMNYIMALKDLGVSLEVIELEKAYSTCRADAYIQFTFNGKRYYQLLEMQLSHYYVDVAKYKAVLEEIYLDTSRHIPTLVIVQNCNKDYTNEVVDGINIVQLRQDLKDIPKVLI